MGTPTTSRARSTTSMARSTPAQNPRGPASTISWSIRFLPLLGPRPSYDPQYTRRAPARREVPRRASPPNLVKEIADAHDPHARVEPEIGATGPPVRDVLEAVPDGDGGALVDEDQDAGAGFEDEVHVAVRLAELGLAGEDPAAGL